MNPADARRLLEDARREAATAIETAANLDELGELERRYAGRRSPAAVVNEAIKTFEPEERPTAGRAVGAYTDEVRALVARRREAIAAEGA